MSLTDTLGEILENKQLHGETASRLESAPRSTQINHAETQIAHVGYMQR